MSYFEVMSDPPSTVSQAARQGNYEEMKRLIEEGHPLDVADNRGWKAVHESAFGDYVHCLRELLSYDVTDVNWQSHEGQTPLFLACQQRHLESVQILLDAGADPNIADHVQTYPLLEAARCASAELMNLLLAKGADVNCQLYCGTTPLHHAASMGLQEIVSLLLSQDARLDVTEENGLTPIFTASQYGHLECLRVMLNHARSTGADTVVNMAAMDGATPLYIAAQDGHCACVELLLEYGADANLMTTAEPRALPLIAAIEFGHLDVIEALIDATDQERFTQCDVSPWYTIFCCGDYNLRYKMARLLLQHGANPNYQHSQDLEEVYTRFPKILRFLPTEAMLFYKCIRPLTKASYFESAKHPSDLIKALLERGAYVNAQSIYELAPIMPALENCKLAILSVLLQNGACIDIYHPKIQGNITILLSLHRWHSFQLLLRSGAEINSIFDYVSYLHCLANYKRQVHGWHNASKDQGTCAYCRLKKSTDASSDMDSEEEDSAWARAVKRHALSTLAASKAEKKETSQTRISSRKSRDHSREKQSSQSAATRVTNGCRVSVKQNHAVVEFSCKLCEKLRHKKELGVHPSNLQYYTENSEVGENNADKPAADTNSGEGSDWSEGNEDEGTVSHICGGGDKQQEIIDNMGFITTPTFFMAARQVMSGSPYHVSFGQVLLSLLSYTGTVNPTRTLMSFIDSAEERRDILEIVENPRSMAHLCRVAIRRCLGSRRIFDQQRTRLQFALPSHILDFIFMKDLQSRN